MATKQVLHQKVKGFQQRFEVAQQKIAEQEEDLKRAEETLGRAHAAITEARESARYYQEHASGLELRVRALLEINAELTEQLGIYQQRLDEIESDQRL
jgi:chromosome segregation ATPase